MIPPPKARPGPGKGSAPSSSPSRPWSRDWKRTAVCGISAQEVSFRLKAKLGIDGRVTLFLDIPRTLILESPLRMVLSGAVVYVRLEEKGEKMQFIVVRLDRGFRLHPNSMPPA